MVVVEIYNYTYKLLELLNLQRLSADSTCDLNIRCMNGKLYPVHRCVLLATCRSTIMCKILHPNFGAKEIWFSKLEEETVRLLLEVAYTGKLVFDDGHDPESLSNLTKLKNAAKWLDFSAAYEATNQYLKKYRNTYRLRVLGLHTLQHNDTIIEAKNEPSGIEDDKTFQRALTCDQPQSKELPDLQVYEDESVDEEDTKESKDILVHDVEVESSSLIDSRTVNVKDEPFEEEIDQSNNPVDMSSMEQDSIKMTNDTIAELPKHWGVEENASKKKQRKPSKKVCFCCFKKISLNKLKEHYNRVHHKEQLPNKETFLDEKIGKCLLCHNRTHTSYPKHFEIVHKAAYNFVSDLLKPKTRAKVRPPSKHHPAKPRKRPMSCTQRKMAALYDATNSLCKICGKEIPRNCLNHHLIRVHERRDLQFSGNGRDPNEQTCKVCGHMSINMYYHKQHLRKHGLIEKLSCKYCSKMYNTSRDLNRHIKMLCLPKVNTQAMVRRQKMLTFTREKQKHICEVCGIKVYGWSMKKHLFQKHGQGQFNHTLPTLVCQKCGKLFWRKTKFEKHFRKCENLEKSRCPFKEIHCETRGRKMYLCEQCDFTSPDKRNVREHLIRKHNYEDSACERFRCETCTKICFSKRELMDCKRKHGAVPKLKCPTCDKAFTCTRGFNAHKKQCFGSTDQSTSPQKIKNMESTDDSKGGSRKQDNNSSGRMIYSCIEHCGYTSVNKQHVHRHQISKHNYDNSAFEHFRCQICTKIYFSNTQMMDCKRKHGAAPKLQCPTCDQEFNSQKALHRHQVCKHNCMDFAHVKCEICTKVCFSKQEIMDCKRKHGAAPKLHCPTCDKTFTYASQLGTHKKQCIDSTTLSTSSQRGINVESADSESKNEDFHVSSDKSPVSSSENTSEVSPTTLNDNTSEVIVSDATFAENLFTDEITLPLGSVLSVIDDISK